MTYFLKFFPATGRLVSLDKVSPGMPTVFDTDAPMLYTPPANVFSGSISIPARSVSSSGVDGAQNILDTTAEYYVGTPNIPSANIIRGLISFDGVTWRNAVGSHIKELDAVGITISPQTDTIGKQFLATMQTFTPLVNALGHVVIQERVVMRARDPGSPPGIMKTIPAFTLHYRIIADFWWGNTLVVPHPDVSHIVSQGVGTQYVPLTVMNGLYAYPGQRRLVLVIESAESAPAPSSVTIDGGAATIHSSVVSGVLRITVASRVLNGPGGVSVPIVLNGSVPVNSVVSAFIVRHTSFATPTFSSATVASGNSISKSITVPDGKECLVVCSKYGSAGSPNDLVSTWANASKLYDYKLSSYYIGSGSGPTAWHTAAETSAAIVEAGTGTVTVQTSWNGAAGPLLMLAVMFG
ncbi:MAG: hypothetical protein HOO99_03870 [Hyphomicrobiaceae bacterium]|nr:hypothetical protein [Hyphomicrobiaceae bacterium]